MMHAISQHHLHLRPEILTVSSVATSKKEAHAMGRHALYVLFRHMIKKPQYTLPSYVQMAIKFTQDHPISINPCCSRVAELGNLISFDTEGVW